MQCDQCDKPAVVHEVTVRHGVKHEVHYCAEHAAEMGYALPGQAPQLTKILQQFVPAPAASATPSKKKTRRPTIATAVGCSGCGLRIDEFRQKGILGCPDCYTSFGRSLQGIIQRAQAGATHHRGKTPRRLGASIDRQLELRRLVKELEDAVASEQFERAASLRDRLRDLESAPAPEAPSGGSADDAPATESSPATRERSSADEDPTS